MLPYNNALDPTLDRYAGPPYYFADVNMQGFPLVADPVQLAYFLDSYLNIGPPQVARYEPACPFVFLLFISYGQQGQSPISGGMEFGFTSQTQISFAIPLARYRLDERGRSVFSGWSCLMPFNFTDGWASVLVSRTVYGWNTSLGWLDRDTKVDLDPDLWQVDYTLKTPLIPDLWRGNPQLQRVLLQVERAPDCEPLRWPPSGAASCNPLYLLPRLLTEAYESADLLCALLGWWWQIGVIRDIPEFFLNLLRSSTPKSVARSLGSSHQPGLTFSLASLKQFRDAEFDNRICYQAMLETGLSLNGIHDFGLLGASRVLTGDLSGGYRIRMNLFDSLPIVSLLGLQATQFENHRALAGSTDSYISVGVKGNTGLAPVESLENRSAQNSEPTSAVLNPVLPFFASYNFTTSPSRVLCWRLRDTNWFVNQSRGGQQTTSELKTGNPLPKRGNPYNSALGAAGLSFAGPFEYSEMTLRVLPLLAHHETMQNFCNRYLNDNIQETGYRFTVWGDFAYVLVNSYERMVSASENVGNWAERSLEVALPVKLYRGSKLLTMGLIVPYGYNNSLIASLTYYETAGFNISIADIESPPSVWDTTYGPKQDQPVLHLWTSLYPAVSLDAYPLPTVLMEILEDRSQKNDGAMPPDSSSTSIENEPGSPRELDSYLSPGSLLNCFTFKQFRSAEIQDTACYQAVVSSWQEIIRSSPAYKFQHPVSLRIHHNAELPLVEILGLKFESSTLNKPAEPNRIWRGNQVYCLQAFEPFWFTIKARSKKNQNVAYRGTGRPHWQTTEDFVPLRSCGAPPAGLEPASMFRELFLTKAAHQVGGE